MSIISAYFFSFSQKLKIPFSDDNFWQMKFRCIPITNKNSLWLVALHVSQMVTSCLNGWFLHRKPPKVDQTKCLCLPKATVFPQRFLCFLFAITVVLPQIAPSNCGFYAETVVQFYSLIVVQASVFILMTKSKDECLKRNQFETASTVALRAQQEGCQVRVVWALILCVIYLFTRPLLFERCCPFSPVILRVYCIANLA